MANGHEYHLYTYAKTKDIPDGTVVKNADEIVPRQYIFKHRKGFGKGLVTGFSDLFRYKLLYDKGGFWCDLDEICLKPFDFPEPYVISSERAIYGKEICCNGNVLKAPRGDLVIKRCYEDSMGKDLKNISFGEIGPPFIDAAVHRSGLSSYVKSPDVFCPIDGRHYQVLVDPRARYEIQNGTYGIHLLHTLWTRKLPWKRKLKRWLRIHVLKKELFCDANKRYNPSTLYGALQKRYL